ncbi:uncharacterized protein PRCAT00001951001 [Priceomyces carsonii]|uniref:uncharacterized protein n=1 Tax=Priceomyces carsonii TaxID=28549 RepID=UPI002ED8BD49|nr:unnamed protein product [Priceomyces carsonii]
MESKNEKNTDTLTLISQYIASANDEISSNPYAVGLSEMMARDEMSLLELIQQLGPNLTSDKDLIRSRAISCLVDTLKELKQLKLSRHDINVLLDFFLAKMEDQNSVQQALSGLKTIMEFKTFHPKLNDNLLRILEVLLKSYEPRKYLARVRYESFEVLSTAMEHHLQFLQSNQEVAIAYVKSFIHVASGEKDPRNLLISFELNKQISEGLCFIGTVHNEELINELFDVCFCYFPISFSPPENDPYKITADDLKLRLRSTIASNSLFAKDSFPSLFEKLTSTNILVRNDVLQTLLRCVISYNQETILQYYVTIWNALKFEVLHNDISEFSPNSRDLIPDYEKISDTDELKPLVLALLIIKELSSTMCDTESSEAFLEMVTNELNDNLKTIKSKLFKHSVLLLSVVASSSDVAFNFIVKDLFSYNIWGKFINLEPEEPSPAENVDAIDISEDILLDIANQRDLVDCLGFIFSSYKCLAATANDSLQFLANNSLRKYKDYLLIFLGLLLGSSSSLERTLRCKVVQQMTKLITLPKYLTLQDVQLVLGYFSETMISLMEEENNWEKDVVVEEIVQGLRVIVEDHSPIDEQKLAKTSLVIEIFLPPLFDRLSFDDGSSCNLAQFKKVLYILKELCVNYQILEVYSVRLLSKLEPLERSLIIPMDSKIEIFEEVTILFSECIYKVEVINQFLTNSWYRNFVPRFLSLLYNLTSQKNDYLLELSSDVIGLIVKFTDGSKHQEIFDDFVRLLLMNKPVFENVRAQNLIEDPNSTITLFNKVLSNIDKSVEVNLVDVKTVISLEIDVIYEIEGDDLLRLNYLQNIALWTNKFVILKSELNFVENKMEFLFSEIVIESDKEFSTHIIKSFEVLIWLIKALVLRNCEIGTTYLLKIIGLLQNKNQRIKELAANSLDIIFIDLPLFKNLTPKVKRIISKVANLNVRLLYKQQNFELILPKLIDGYTETKDEYYLLSMSLILKNLPSNILRPHLKTILPLILNSLLIKNSTTLNASLSTLDVIINENPDLIVPHVSSIIPKLIELSVGKVASNKKLVNDVSIRLLSLECLSSIIGKIDLQYLLKYKHNLIQSLEKGLDDKKRDVRKLCSDLRQALFELGR